MNVTGIITGEKHKELLQLLDQIKNNVKSSDAYSSVCKEHGVTEEILDFVPMAFADLEVSARTENGIMFFNSRLIDSPEDIEHYMIHEFNHVLQQCFGDGPTMKVDQDNYLDDENEKESFQSQTEYIGEVKGPEEAEKYVDKVLDHHDIKGKERKERREELNGFANSLT
jgi:hypothetical protein